ncbi:Lrp/AsnC family transcriptional regulator [Fretibacter rubidus]|uniref:Lrp/AsnC family transcriptional regulator n=1 Tax=Fretibacter rubidus TaxID=570162 RepID=UPI00352B76BB
MAGTEFEFSELDVSIVEILKKDGRISNQKIADELGVTTSIIGTRIKRMEEAKAMKVVAVADFAALNYNYLFPIGIDVKGRMAKDVASDLAELKEIIIVQLVVGKHDIEILVALSDMAELGPFLMEKLSKIKGVRSLDAGFAADIVKYDFDVAPI